MTPLIQRPGPHTPPAGTGRRATVRTPLLAPFLALVLLMGAAPAAAQSPTVPPDGERAFVDDLELGARLVGWGLSAPGRWTARQWLTLPAAAGVLALVGMADDDVHQMAHRNQGRVGDAIFNTVEPFGEAYSIPLVIGLYAGGAAFDRPGLQRTAVEAAAASVVAAGVVTPVLKLAFGRARPRREVGSDAFDPFGGDKSFPSGHTTQAFALASVFAAESDSWVVDVLAYGVAAGVGGARIYHDAHFLTDVLAGAAIGTVVGRTMVHRGRVLTGATVVGGGGERGVTVGLRIPLN